MKKIGGLVIMVVLIFLGFQFIVPGQREDAQIFRFQFKSGEPLYYRMAVNMDIGINMNVLDQTIKTDISIKMKWTIKLTPKNINRDRTLLNMETTSLEVDWDITSPQGKVKATMRGDHVVSTQNGVTIIDTKKGIGVAQAETMTREIEPIKMTGQMEIFPTGKYGKIIGDPKFVKFWTESMEAQVSFFGIFFPKKPIAVGDSFYEDLTLKKMGQIMLQEPGLKCKVTITRQPEKKISGCTVSEFKISSPFSQKNLLGYFDVGVQKMQVDIQDFKRAAIGSAVFDNKKGILVDSHLDIDAIAKMKMTSGLKSTLLDMDMKITIDIQKLEK